MEGSASAPCLPSRPVLTNEDYVVPTGVYERITHGPFTKDKGTYSSRINQIVRQAEKVPGPGKYVSHEPWDEGKKAHVIHAGNKFPNGTRDYKPYNKTPAPATYEHKEFQMGKSIGGGEHLSNRQRVIYGQIPKGKKRSALDQAIAHGARSPAPGHYELKPKRNNKLDVHTTKMISDWSRELSKNKGKGPPEKEIGPDHYSPNFDAQQEKQPCHAIPKAKAQNFLDKAVKEKLVCLRTKKEVPGPGTYNQDYDDSKFSRGTKCLQLRGMGRSSVSGYF